MTSPQWDPAGYASGRYDDLTQPIGAPPGPPARQGTGMAALLVAVVIGVAISVGLGVYGRLHQPTGYAINIAGFSSGITAKVWLASIAFLFALIQLISALIMYGRFPGVSHGPSWIGGLHRWSGRLAVLISVPVAAHCLYALGFDPSSPRVLAHSLLGCFFYGAFATKMIILSRPKSPGWSLPLLGGLVFTALTGLWLTSALWFFSTSGVHL
jgi:Family of unknown function (DUF6529)